MKSARFPEGMSDLAKAGVIRAIRSQRAAEEKSRTGGDRLRDTTDSAPGDHEGPMSERGIG